LPPRRLTLPTSLIERETCQRQPLIRGDSMKKIGILHSQLSAVIAALGHTDMLVISDAGLAVPPGVPCIDLAVTAGLPRFLEVVQAVAGEVHAERLLIARELEERNTTLPAELKTAFPNAEIGAVSHESFKDLVAKARAVVRTGETTPYANVIIYRGVTF
jgi:D-ribose pyranase